MTKEQVDIAVVGELCALALAARRLGCRIAVVEASPELIDLIVFAGLDEQLLGHRIHDDAPE